MDLSMSSNNHHVISFVHPTKLGLLDHAEALTEYGTLLDEKRSYHTHTSIFNLAVNLIQMRRNGSQCICVFWDNSINTLIAMLLCSLFRVPKLYYLHEPGGIGQKLSKGDPFIYSLKAAFAESLFKSVSSMVLVARCDKLAFGDYYAPLLFNDDRPVRVNSSRVIGFLGAKRNHRLYHIWQRISAELVSKGYELREFPSADYGKTNAEKVSFLSECACVWNCYGVPYNQSGVTGDCIASAVPCIVSGYEPFAKELKELELLIELDIKLPESEMVAQLIDQLEKNIKHDTACKDRTHQFASEIGGRLAFSKYWLPIFHSL